MHYIKGWLSRLFDYVGRYTLEILTFHFLSFKIVSIALILLYGVEIERLAEHPVLKSLTGMEWIAYTIVGISVPILIVRAYQIIKSKIMPFSRIVIGVR